MKMNLVKSKGQPVSQVNQFVPVRLRYSRRKGAKLVSPNGLPNVCCKRPSRFGWWLLLYTIAVAVIVSDALGIYLLEVGRPARPALMPMEVLIAMFCCLLWKGPPK